MQLPKITSAALPLITAPAIDTGLLWTLSTVFLGLAVLYFESVFFFRNRISSKSSRTKQLKTELSPMISEFLFYEEDADKEEKSHYIALKIEIRDLLENDLNRKILAGVLLDLRKDVAGDTQKRLFKLYQDMGLEKDAFKKLGSWRWEVISKGILELTQMQVGDAYGFIVKFINDRRSTIRKQAEIASVTLKPDGIDYFLDTTCYKISEWQQLKLLDVLRNKTDFEPPRFKAWLTSTNKHVVLFALRLIRYYNQNDANASLIELIKHSDPQVRRQAIECIEEFHIVEALPILKGVFWKCSVDIKITVLGAIAELGDTADIEFLETVSVREGNFSVKSKATGAINAIAPGSVIPTENIEFVSAYEGPEKHPEPEKYPEPEKHPEPEEYLEPEERPEPNPPEPVNHMGNPPEKEYPEKETTITIIANINPTEKYSPMPNTNHTDHALRNLEVHFEVVMPRPSEEQFDATNPSFDASEIHFLPLVIAGETDEISSEPMDEELEALVAEIKELAFLSFVTDGKREPSEEVPDNENSDNENSDMETSDIETSGVETSGVELQDAAIGNETESPKEIEGYSLSDFEVSFREKNAETEKNTDSNSADRTENDDEEQEVVAFDLEDAAIIDVQHPQVEDVMTWLMADNELREIECNYDTVPYAFDVGTGNDMIPEPVYYDEHEAYMMGLLDDLEEMGDHREIPLLEELRAEERKNFIKDRIDGMMEKFAREKKTKTSKKSETGDDFGELPVFSVFADLFKTIDTECKLILLDEIVHVGDEKEIEFLDGLLENPDQQIRLKAQTVLRQLIAKLSQDKPLAAYSQRVSAIVAEQIKSDEVLSQQIYDGLLSEMDLEPAEQGSTQAGKTGPNNPTKEAPIASEDYELLEISFELGEGLDRNCDAKIRELNVIATEIAPNPGGGSLLNNLRNFTKLF